MPKAQQPAVQDAVVGPLRPRPRRRRVFVADSLAGTGVGMVQRGGRGRTGKKYFSGFFISFSMFFACFSTFSNAQNLGQGGAKNPGLGGAKNLGLGHFQICPGNFLDISRTSTGIFLKMSL